MQLLLGLILAIWWQLNVDVDNPQLITTSSGPSPIQLATMRWIKLFTLFKVIPANHCAIKLLKCLSFSNYWFISFTRTQ